MSIYINGVNENIKKKLDALKGLFDKKKGSSIILRPDLIGHRYMVLHAVKVSIKSLHIYCFNKYGWWEKIDHLHPAIKVTRDDITIVKGTYSEYQRWDSTKIGSYAAVVRGFLSMGMIPNIGIKYLRNGTLVKFNNVEVAAHFPMKFDWDQKLYRRML